MELITAGQKFGRWQALEDQKYTFNDSVTAQCVCGTKRKVRAASLRSGHSKSCGCLNKEILAATSYKKRTRELKPGDVYGRLTVKDATHHGRVVVECICGTVKTVRAAALYQGNTKSCGCLHIETATQLGMSRRTRNGFSRHQLYSTWQRMLISGLPVHPAWRTNVEAFITDLESQLGPRPAGSWTRLKTQSLGFVPGNVFWGPKMSPNQRVVLTPQQRADIAAAVRAGTTQRDMAEQYQVSVALVSTICKKLNT